MKRVSGLLCSMLLSLAACLLPGAVLAKPYSELIVFGGSFSDVGNIMSIGGQFGPPFAHNRTTNGPNVEDYLSQMLDFPNEPSLHLIGPPVGNNFAVFEALASRNGPHDLQAQIDAYLASRGGKADPHALHFILIGGSDVIQALLKPDDQAATKVIDDAVGGVETALRRLVRAGAKTIFAPNFADLGITPYAIKNGVTKRATRLSVDYNRKYDIMLNRVERQLRFELIRWYFDTYSKHLFNHVEELGFINWTDACIDLEPTGQCDLSRFFFLHEFFPTTKSQQLFASALIQALIERDDARCQRGGGRHSTAGKCHKRFGADTLDEQAAP
jgi:phospholipase/lecithinase/hemolysin